MKLMNKTWVAAAALLAATAQAAVVVVPASTLDDLNNAASYTYAGLDGAGTSMTATASGGGTMTTIGSGMFQGLWFGSNQSSGTYTFSFSAPVDFFSLHVNAMSTFGSYVETIGSFTIDTAASLTFAFTNIQNAAWDGSTVTSGPNDNGEFVLQISAAPGDSFSSVSFFHFQAGSPNGSVVRDIEYQLAAVPEPQTWALLLLGMAALGAAARRRRS